MPICHISCKSVSHSTGRTAPAAAAYRAGDRIKNEHDGRTHDYSRKSGVEHAEIIVPDGTPKPTRAELWNAAEKADTRKNSVVAREWEVALPCELSAKERKTLALEFGRWLCAEYGVVADVAIHAPNAKGDQRNHHAHIMTTTRYWGEDGQLKEKTRILDAKDTRAQEVTKVRKAWETLCNRALERAGSNERISAGKLPDGQTATIHVGVGAKAITRKGGEVSSRELHNERVMELRRLAAELAAAREAEPPEQQAPAQPEQAPAAAEPEGPAPAAPSPEEEAAIAATIDEMCGTFEEPPAPAEKSDLEKRRDVILAHPQCIGNNGAREVLTRDGWEQWVEPLELALGIGGKEKEQPQPAKEKTPEEIEDERIDRECEAKAAEWEQLVSARASQIWSAADKAEKAARDEWCKARDQLDALKEQKKQLGTLAKWRGKDKELDAEAGRLTAAQKAAYGRELEAQARKDNARALAEKELRAKLKPEEREHLDKCLARAKERRAERDRQLAIEQEKQRAQQRPARSQGRGWSR